MNPTKVELRESLQKARLALTSELRREKANAIAMNLLQAINWSVAQSVHCFEPIMRLGEVDLTDFVVTVQTDREDIHIYTSRKIGDGWQIVSTDTDKPVVVPKFDVIIVPMLGFDASLHRLGYGGGYYDHFLASQPAAKKIGVCYELGKVEKIEAESHDVQLDVIVTEQKTYTKS
jgi:5-formyltetrahydrofolate cyclo-ligase